jgi:hypothetical protein
MKRPMAGRWATGCIFAVAVALAGRYPLAAAPQPVMQPAYYAGATPEPNATACPGESAELTTVVSPRITIAPASAANFRAHNPSGNGSAFAEIRFDGVASILIPPTPDIDAALRQSLAAFAQRLTIKPVIPGCGHIAELLLIGFSVPDGDVRAVRLAVPPAAFSTPVFTSAVPLPSPVPEYIGVAPDFTATPCPGEGQPVYFSAPRHMDIPPASADYYRAHNATSIGIASIVVRMDGQSAAHVPEQLNIDPGMEDALLGFLRHVTVAPPIAGCPRAGLLYIMRFSVPDGAVDHTRFTPPRAATTPAP